ncbi:allene oxide synthase 2-like [Phalaenopsis equestris]|uniref:allene oxide synthase 2-like n=1 Tax=Phalaenopsis equestris TaxID=78828 RepID=UPI0009E24AF5|nr:allene oxide synthase 2-like [Phalaenopsis equestris]
MSSAMQKEAAEAQENTGYGDHSATSNALKIKEIPGSCGIPFVSPFLDRLEYFYFKGQDKFFQSRIERYGSTVFRANMPPGPFMASNPRVIVVLDAKSFPVLFDNTKIEKKDVLYGTYIPSTKLTGNYRICANLDPSEPSHTKVKQFLFNLLASRKSEIVPAFRASFITPVFTKLESQIASDGRSDFNKLNDHFALEFLCDAYFGTCPSKTGISLDTKAIMWLLPQLAPLASKILAERFFPLWFLEDLLLHTFPIPSFLVKSQYKALYSYFESVGAHAVDNIAAQIGLSREEAINNLLYTTIFNAYGGFKVLFPIILKWLASCGKHADLHARIASEVRSAVGENGQLTITALENMDLVKSVVYEALRIEPPVPYQYGHAKKDFVLENHDAAFLVRKGEMIFGYQPFATTDSRVFGSDAQTFVPDRFVGDDGKLLKYLCWSNGPETEDPTVGNKQCAGKNFVVLVSRLLVAELFLRYDSFTAEASKISLGAQVTFTDVTKAKPKLA